MCIAMTALGIKQHAIASNSELMFRLGLFALSVRTALDDGDVLQISLKAVRLNQGFFPLHAWPCKLETPNVTTQHDVSGTFDQRFELGHALLSDF